MDCGQAEQKSIGRTHYFFLTLGGQSLSHWKILFSKHQSAITETSTQSKQSGLAVISLQSLFNDTQQ